MNISLRLLSIAALTLSGVSQVQAQTVMELKYPSNAPGVTPCVYTTDGAGISADPATGRLLATGDFSTGCPQTGPALPLPVIVPGPQNWSLPNPWTVGTSVALQWAAVNAATCTYAGSSATGWPSGSQACAGSACESLKNIAITPNAAGTYSFTLNCVNATGGATSTSASAVVSPATVVNPTISAGPGTWGNLLPWTAGGTKSVNWSASNADNCAFTGSFPSGVTLANFVSGSTSCGSAAACASAHPLTLTGSVAGNYSLSLTCTNNAGGGPVVSSNTWTVSPASTGSCATVSGWNRKQDAAIYYNNTTNYLGNFDVTTFESIWGRDYPSTGGSGTGNINATWPGNQGNATAEFGNGEYLSLKFRTPNTTTFKSSQLVIDGTSFSLAGGGSGNTAKMSMTVSKRCGDFDTASVDIPQYCFRSQMIANNGFNIVSSSTSAPSPAYCLVQPNTDYYLNIIFAPLTTPATAVFNGVSGVVQIRNLPQN